MTVWLVGGLVGGLVLDVLVLGLVLDVLVHAAASRAFTPAWQATDTFVVMAFWQPSTPSAA